jgi:alkylhydroperoxidase/carboxymuconolactone decarboxylase family protein YurZ
VTNEAIDAPHEALCQAMVAGDLAGLTSIPAGGNTEQLGFHLGRAIENGVTREELIEAITHVTLYAGWPKGMAAMGVAKRHFTESK